MRFSKLRNIAPYRQLQEQGPNPHPVLRWAFWHPTTLHAADNMQSSRSLADKALSLGPCAVSIEIHAASSSFATQLTNCPVNLTMPLL